MEMKNEWVKDPKIFNVNRLSATASIHRYASIKELKEKQSSFNYSLNGSWKFHYATGFNQLIPEFSNKDYCVDHWDEIKVPGHYKVMENQCMSIKFILGQEHNKLFLEKFLIRIQLEVMLHTLTVQ